MGSDPSLVNILVATSNRILSEGLCHFLTSQQSKYTCFSDFQENSFVPTLILFDPSKPMEQLQIEYPDAKYILMDTGLPENEISYLLLNHSVSGVISTDTCMEMFFKALKVVLKGQIWIDNKHLKVLLQNNGATSKIGCIKTLSKQDKNISQMVALGLKNKEIAHRLCLSEHTIKAHLSRIFKTLNINSRTKLAGLVLAEGQKKILE